MGIGLTAVILGCVGLGIYLLYIHGYAPVQSKRALFFVGSMGLRKGCNASFQSTTGVIRRVIRWKQPGAVTFCFTGNITKGRVDAFVFDKKKQVLLTLNPECPTGQVYVEAKERYYLSIRFKKADGDYQIKWD